MGERAPEPQRPVPALRAWLCAALAVGAAALGIRQVIPVGEQVWGLQLGYFASYVFLFALGCVASRDQWLDRLERAGAALALGFTGLHSAAVLVGSFGWRTGGQAGQFQRRPRHASRGVCILGALCGLEIDRLAAGQLSRSVQFAQPALGALGISSVWRFHLACTRFGGHLGGYIWLGSARSPEICCGGRRQHHHLICTDPHCFEITFGTQGAVSHLMQSSFTQRVAHTP